MRRDTHRRSPMRKQWRAERDDEDWLDQALRDALHSMRPSRTTSFVDRVMRKLKLQRHAAGPQGDGGLVSRSPSSQRRGPI